MRIEVGFNDKNERVGVAEFVERRASTSTAKFSASPLKPTTSTSGAYRPKFIQKILDDKTYNRPVVNPPTFEERNYVVSTAPRGSSTKKLAKKKSTSSKKSPPSAKTLSYAQLAAGQHRSPATGIRYIKMPASSSPIKAT